MKIVGARRWSGCIGAAESATAAATATAGSQGHSGHYGNRGSFCTVMNHDLSLKGHLMSDSSHGPCDCFWILASDLQGIRGVVPISRQNSGCTVVIQRGPGKLPHTREYGTSSSGSTWSLSRVAASREEAPWHIWTTSPARVSSPSRPTTDSASAASHIARSYDSSLGLARGPEQVVQG